MANQKQLEILMQGVDNWNTWRKENHWIGIDIEEATLWEANYDEVFIKEYEPSRADLTRIKLIQANLCGADFVEVDLKGANLRGADLKGANLSGADLRGAFLHDADLSKAILFHTVLEETFLDLTVFTEARFGRTKLSKLDLGNTIGLQWVLHSSPSTIDFETIQRSQGNIPRNFLIGCGLSDWEIESTKLYREGLPAKEINDIVYRIYDLRAKGAIQYYSVFISYSTKDQAFVQKLHDNLQDSGVRCWFAPEDVRGGKKLHEQIDSAIQSHDRLLLVLSEYSMNSEWVKTEISNARQKEVQQKRRVLFPISLVEFEKIREWKCFDADTGKDSAREIREYFIPDFSQWKEEGKWRPAFERLLKDLRAKDGENERRTTEDERGGRMMKKSKKTGSG